MKIGFAGRWHPNDKTKWSGIYYSTWKELCKHHTVEVFYYTWPFYVREYLLLHKLFQKLIGKKAAVEFLTSYAKYFSKQLEKDLCKRKVDLLFCPGAPQLLAYCTTSIPVVYMADASFQQLQGYYDNFSGMANYNIIQGINLDKKAFSRAAHCMLASGWARASAIQDYGINSNKISVIPFGANTENISSEGNVEKKKNGVCKLLFLGVEWERKGGAIALDTIRILNNTDFPVQLTIIGCAPRGFKQGEWSMPGVTVIPFINRNNIAAAAQLREIMLQTDFLLLPARAECAGIVFCEAAAFGIPSITTDTGGIGTYVEHNSTGFTLPLTATAKAYAKLIMDMYKDDLRYRQISKNSRNKFEQELNWEVWGKQFNTIAEMIIEH
ncbi:MAG: glycosyltransferase family 4 protein [Ferruginibacter sp.]